MRLPCQLNSFGLVPALQLLRSPIFHFLAVVLDFHLPFHRSGVQFAAFSLTFWTSSSLSSVSASNLPLSRGRFGLPLTLPTLQGPIRHFLTKILDFLQHFLCHSVQSAKSPASACSPCQLYSSTCIWQTFIAASALACDSGVTPAQHFASTDITTSGLTALIVMALLITQISVHTPTSSTSV